MKKTLLFILSAGILLLGGVGNVAAVPLYLTFETESIIGTGGIVGSDHIGNQYVVMIETDESIAKSNYLDQYGVIHYQDDIDTAAYKYDTFYIEGISANYISSGNNRMHIGTWGTHTDLKVTCWGTGDTYGTFGYHTRMGLTYGRDSYNGVSINGFWADWIWPPIYPDSLLSSDAKWMLYDHYITQNGHEIYGTFWASLVDVSDVDPTNPVLSTPEPNPVPEPSTMFLFGTGLVVFAGFRKKNRL